MKLLKGKILLFFFLVLKTNFLWSQRADAIDHLGIENGLSNSAVRSFCQDHNGFMWIGTNDGLNRYDGYDFEVFRNSDGDTTSIIQNWINVIAEDANQKLWVGTHGGVSIYNYLTETFSPVYYQSGNGGRRKKLVNDTEEIKFDKSGNAYLRITGEGLVMFERNKYQAGIVIPFQNARYDYKVQAICIGSGQSVWVLVDGVGLCKYNSRLKRLQLVNNNHRSASRLLSCHNFLWLCGPEGIERYNINKNIYDRHYGEAEGMLASTRISAMIEGNNDGLWIATDGAGINILNEKTNKFSYITSGEGKRAIASNAVLALFKDNRSRIWIGTYRGGLNIIDPYKSGFVNIKHETGISNSLVSNFVLSICEQSPDKLWIGTDGGGVSLLNRKSNQYTNFVHHGNNPGSLGGNAITSIRKDFEGNIWLAAYDGCISKYIAGTRSFTHYYAYVGAKRLKNATFWLIYEDRKKRLWAGALQYGLFLFNRKTNRFEQFDTRLNDLIALKEDKSGQFWGGGWNTLVRIKVDTKQYERYKIGYSVRSIFEDQKGNFWIGTEGGLFLFDRRHKRVLKRYTADDGLANNHIMNILGDEDGNLWLSTYNGLSRFDPRTQTFKTYSTADGLPEKEFNYNASAALSSGELAFGNVKGLTLFFPKKISQRRSNPDLVFTRLTINNTPAGLSKYITRVSGGAIKEIKVPYDQAIFTFSFTAIDFPYAEHINYRYRLLNRDREWNNGSSARSASYARLEPGVYDFQVNCTNKDGRWGKEIISIHIIVSPPWYRTWLAYFLYVIAAGVSIYAYVTYRVNQTRIKYEIMIVRENEKKQRALQEKEREIHNSRLDFFTSITHEFRTPLSLIINPIKDMMMREHNNDDKELKIVYRNARRLLSLVDQLLLFRKTDSGVGEMRVTTLNIGALCTEVFYCFSQQARANGINYQLVTNDRNIVIFGDREKLEIILFNLISNAIKFTPPGGSVSVNIIEDDHIVSIRVQDSGCGIAAKESDNIFEKFYQSRTDGRPAKSGFGVGLYLARQFANRHHANLTYKSEVNKGTLFELTLKKGKSHFDPNIISEDTITESPILEELLYDDRGSDTLDKACEPDFKALDIFTDRKIILVIDDDKEIRNYINTIFNPDYLVYEASDGEMGMLMVKEKNPDLIICDVMMPGMSGIEWCSWLKNDQAYSYIPVILLTASLSSETKLKGIDCGADDYISKPFEKDLLVARVANLLNIRNNLRSYFYNEITLKTNSVAVSEEYKAFLQKCIEIVESHLTDSQFNIKVLAGEIGMSHSNLYRKVKSLSGYTVTAFVRLIRLRKAAEMLINTDYNVNQVAIETGFNNIKYFRSQFFKLFGVNPSDFAKRNKPVFQKKINIKL